ncbi:MAG: ABC transporter permease [Candidatus Berkelbacteria bacterium]|nr:ABC transporter permease [Candidatus Berkelbacteria bacterium]
MFKLFFPNLKMLFRNRQQLFWALMFPLLFTFIFGFFFGKNSTTGEIILINKSSTEIATSLDRTITDSGVFKVDTNYSDIEAATDQVKKGKVAAVLVIPENFGTVSPDASKTLEVIDDPANATTNVVLLGILDKFNAALTFQLNKISEPAFTVDEQKTNTRNLSYFDFVLAGLLGLALMNASIMGIAITMAKYREDKIFKRLTVTPMKSWWFIINEVLSRLVLNFIQISIILLIGRYMFDAHIYGNYFVIYALALLGGVLFQLIGFAIASIVKTADAAQGAAMAITIPMMFLGGVFFPVDGLPKWLFSIVQYLPLAPLLRMIRGVALDGTSPFLVPSNMILVLAWIAFCLIFASWKFRFSEE